MGDRIEVRDSVIMGDVSINSDPIRVECPSCKKSGMLTLYLCNHRQSDCCYERICHTCFDENPICIPCRELIDLQEQEKANEQEQSQKLKQDELQRIRIARAKKELEKMEDPGEMLRASVYISVVSFIVLIFIENMYGVLSELDGVLKWTYICCGFVFFVGLFSLAIVVPSTYFRKLYLIKIIDEEE